MDKGIKRIAFEFWAGIGSIQELQNWAQKELAKESVHPDVHALFNQNYPRAKDLALTIASDLHGFTPESEQSELWAKDLLKDFAQKLLDEEMSVFTFCEFVRLCDGQFLDLRPMEEGYAYYPEWLGGLMSSCDWCDETWQLHHYPELQEEVGALLTSEL